MQRCCRLGLPRLTYFSFPIAELQIVTSAGKTILVRLDKHLQEQHGMLSQEVSVFN